MSTENCSLVIESSVEVFAPAEASLSNKSSKRTVRASIPLRTITLENAVLIENDRDDFGPPLKWGVLFALNTKEIDLETVETVQEGNEAPKQIRETESDKNIYYVIGVRKEAVAFLGVVKQAISRCQN